MVSVMKDTISENLSKPIDATKKLRPVGMVADKITPNKRTGHIKALIIPIPENPLSKPLLDSVMLEMPPVIDHTESISFEFGNRNSEFGSAVIGAKKKENGG